MSCKLDLQQISRRITRKSYTGAAATGVGSNYNYAYTLSDTVGDNNFWEVLFASAVIVGGAGTAINRVGLWMLQPGKIPSNNLQPYHADPFFTGNSVALCNPPPIGNLSVRVDEINDGQTQDDYAVNSERVLVRSRKLFVPPGCTLMVHGGGYGVGNGGNLGEQFTLNVWYVQGNLGVDDGDVVY
jgi:hypothetical protein